MSLIRLDFPTKPPDEFKECDYYLCVQFGLVSVKKSRYLKIHHVAFLLGMDINSATTYVANSKHVHGFMLHEKIYIHPVNFTKRYMKMLIANIDREMDKEKPIKPDGYIH